MIIKLFAALVLAVTMAVVAGLEIFAERRAELAEEALAASAPGGQWVGVKHWNPETIHLDF